MLQDQELPDQSDTRKANSSITPTTASPARPGLSRLWQHWAPYAVVIWSLIYAALGLYWAVSGQGFPYTPESVSPVGGPLASRFGPDIAWIIVIALGIPAVIIGALMLRSDPHFRSLLIATGIFFTVILLFFMTDLTLLEMLAYIPFTLFRWLSGGDVNFYLQSLSQIKWILAHQLFCLIGGFLWLAATVSYTRRSTGACLYCGRRNGQDSWSNPHNAARWGRVAVYVSLVVPVFYAITRYAWAIGIPLGMTEEYLRHGQERGQWISGLFLANVGLIGALLSLGLIQRWGEVFPRWMIGLAGRRVPIPLAVVPASLMSVLFIVSGIAILSGWSQLNNGAAFTGQNIWIVMGPVMLFPLWGLLLAIATLGYYYRRRGPCRKCGRGDLGNADKPITQKSIMN